jgi:hypothetical protein
MSCCAVLCCPVLSCAVLCCPVLSCAVLCCPVLSCAVLCCPVLSCAARICTANVGAAAMCRRTGATALIRAAMYGHTEVVKVFLALVPARVNDTDATLCTALMRAAEAGHIETCRVLIAGGADVLAVNDRDRTAVQLARKRRFGDGERDGDGRRQLLLCSCSRVLCARPAAMSCRAVSPTRCCSTCSQSHT